mgnify:CR=1 FL=1
MNIKKPNWPHGNYDAQAAYWLAQLVSSDASPAVHKAFKVWRDEDPKHLAAFEQAYSAWHASETLMLDPEILALRKEILSDAFQKRPRLIRNISAAAAVIVMAIIGVITLPVLQPKTIDTPSDTYTVDEPQIFRDHAMQVVVADVTIRERFETGPSERKTIILADDSIMDLNANTVVEIAFSESKRDLNMAKGQAVFKVAHNPERPFSVRAGDRSITALGTEFEVTIEQTDIAVTLLEGKVVVDNLEATRRNAKAESVELSPGQILRTRGNNEASVDQADLTKTGAWRARSLAFNGEKLSAAVLLLNRYGGKKIIIDDPSLGDLKLGGTYKTDSRTGLIIALEEYYPIEAIENPETGEIHLSWEPTSERPLPE